MEIAKGQIVGKYLIVEEPFSIKGRKHCKSKCLWCGKEITNQLRSIKKGKGCSCTGLHQLNEGQEFGLLKVISFSGKDVVCKCKCGNIKSYLKGNLITGNSTSCGCDRKERLVERSTKHGMSRTKIYQIYLGIKARCYNPNEYAYKWYGNLGVTVCNEWLGENGFNNFYDWAINNGYVNGLSIERKDVSKGYSPDNCTWISIDKQHENTSNTIRIYNATGFCFVKDISEKYNVPKSTIYAKIKKIGKENLTEEKLINLLKGVD